MDNGTDQDSPILAVVFLTSAGQVITKSALRDFRQNVLENDDIFRSEFLSNVVFYGGGQDEVELEAGVIEELGAEDKPHTFSWRAKPLPPVPPLVHTCSSSAEPGSLGECTSTSTTSS